VNLTISSDPGDPKTMKEELSGSERELWKESIRKEIGHFMSRGVETSVKEDGNCGAVKKLYIKVDLY
jgi:hypothetical protein